MKKLDLQRPHEGLIQADYTGDKKDDVSDLMQGQGDLGSAISKTSGKGGKFTGLTR